MENLHFTLHVPGEGEGELRVPGDDGDPEGEEGDGGNGGCHPVVDRQEGEDRTDESRTSGRIDTPSYLRDQQIAADIKSLKVIVNKIIHLFYEVNNPLSDHRRVHSHRGGHCFDAPVRLAAEDLRQDVRDQEEVRLLQRPAVLSGVQWALDSQTDLQVYAHRWR